MNVVESSAWLEYFAGGPNAEHFVDAVGFMNNAGQCLGVAQSIP